jgi:hypothetical protein
MDRKHNYNLWEKYVYRLDDINIATARSTEFTSDKFNKDKFCKFLQNEKNKDHWNNSIQFLFISRLTQEPKGQLQREREWKHKNKAIYNISSSDDGDKNNNNENQSYQLEVMMIIQFN